MAQPVVYTDDPDATWTFTVTSQDANVEVDWASPLVAIDGGAYDVACTWEGPAAVSRQVKVPLGGLTKGTKTLYLQVPTGTDIQIGTVKVRDRTG